MMRPGFRGAFFVGYAKGLGGVMGEGKTWGRRPSAVVCWMRGWGEIGGAAPKPPRKGMIPLRILIEFESRSSFAWTVFKLVGVA